MAKSLDELSSNLSDGQCKNLREFYKDEDVFKLMRRKGVYPYEYMDSWERFEETKLPPKEAFYSKLNMKGISVADYEHAEKVWERITPEGERVTLGDYHDVYLATDVLLLADVFETFRDTCFGALQAGSCALLYSPWFSVASSLEAYRAKIRAVN